jgi:chemotaxis protein CheD
MSSQTRIEVFLHPGEWHFGHRDTLIRTLLGSCVSITLWHPQEKVGGMCHYLLAQRKEHPHGSFSGRYADEALLLLLHELLATGLPLKEFRVKLIGGASVLPSFEKKLPMHDVPARNIDAARTLARQLGLNISAEDLGGNSARIVLFDIDTGDVWVRQSQETEIEGAPSKRRQRA